MIIRFRDESWPARRRSDARQVLEMTCHEVSIACQRYGRVDENMLELLEVNADQVRSLIYRLCGRVARGLHELEVAKTPTVGISDAKDQVIRAQAQRLRDLENRVRRQQSELRTLRSPTDRAAAALNRKLKALIHRRIESHLEIPTPESDTVRMVADDHEVRSWAEAIGRVPREAVLAKIRDMRGRRKIVEISGKLVRAGRWVQEYERRAECVHCVRMAPLRAIEQDGRLLWEHSVEGLAVPALCAPRNAIADLEAPSARVR